MEKFNYYDFGQPDFDTETFVSPVEPEHIPKQGVPLNAYKQFKAIKSGHTYYMSGKEHRGYRG